MVARSESWRPSAERWHAAVAAAVAIAVFLGAWSLLHHGFYKRHQIVDTPVYERYGDAMAGGDVPYRDFAVEYPPGALPVFVLPALGHRGDPDAFRRVFEALMWVAGALGLACGALVLRELAASRAGLWAALGFAALAPLALGSVVLTRFDLWPAALTVAALAALLAGRDRLGLGVLGLAVATKIYPGVLLPLALVTVWRRSGRREALAAAGVFAAVVVACFAPFVALSPGGVWDSVVRQASRPLQIESLGSGWLLAAHQVFGLSIAWDSSHGSQNLTGTGTGAAAALASAAQIAALLAIWIAFARGPADGGRLVRYAAAAVCAFVAFGKVLSPQFLVWLVPLVPLVRGRRGLVASALLGVALVLTQAWFPFRYWKLVYGFDELSSWLVLGRDLVLLGLLAALVWPERPERPPPLGRSAS